MDHCLLGQPRILGQTMSRKTNTKMDVLIHYHNLRYWAGEAGRLILRLVWLYSETLPKRKKNKRSASGNRGTRERRSEHGRRELCSPSLWHHIHRPGSAQKGGLGVGEPVREKPGCLGRTLVSDDWQGSFDLSCSSSDRAAFPQGHMVRLRLCQGLQHTTSPSWCLARATG